MTEVLFGNYRQPVGGETEPASKLALLEPWLGLWAVIAFLGIGVVRSRRRAGSVQDFDSRTDSTWDEDKPG